jgi:hypothetical protein
LILKIYFIFQVRCCFLHASYRIFVQPLMLAFTITPMHNTKHADSNTINKSHTRPLDPSRSGEDLLGDTTGLTGVTTGSAMGTSAIPDDAKKDDNKNHLPGGVMTGKGETDDIGEIPDTAIDEHAYDADVAKGMSQARVDAINDIASEDDVPDHSQAGVSDDEIEKDAIGVNIQNAAGDDSPGSNDVNTETAPYQQPENIGGQSVSGSESDPTADDDTQANAFGMGEQLGEDADAENPQPVGLGEDVDRSEDWDRTH